MPKQVLVQRVANDPESYYWGIVDDKGQWQDSPSTGDKAALLSSLERIQLPIILVIPGEKVVVTRVNCRAAEKRHFLQLLPYQLEEHIVSDVENLHFATAPLTVGAIVVAYIDDLWFAEMLAEYRDRGFSVGRCVADFQLIAPAADQWIIWSAGSRILCAHSSGLGFAAHRRLLQPLLAHLFNEAHAPQAHSQTAAANNAAAADDQPQASAQNNAADEIQLYSDSKESLDHLIQCLPDNVRAQAVECPGEPPLDRLGRRGIDFCQGPYEHRLPLGHWWRSSRTGVFLAIAALAAFIAVNLLEVFQLTNQQQQIKQRIEQQYRRVVPQGAMADPVKQLQRRLGATDTTASNNSQVMYLLSVTAPAIKAQAITITTLAYHDKNKELRLNIEAKAFSAIESLRKQLQTDGLQAQLKRSHSADNSVRARLHISLDNISSDKS